MQRDREHCTRYKITLGSISHVMGHRNMTNPSSQPFSCATNPFHSSISRRWISLSTNLHFCLPVKPQLGTPDEVIHLAAGLQFSGVKSVVGTLWRVNDSTVQRLVGAFYENLCGDGTMNSKRVARALHRAVQSLACDKDLSLDQRIVFMHIGV
ncbi:hypothetical protein EDB19DRAFT_1794609 [Suillus lakei]|nr:hypothetical protein EDB19DRAFT_1794609 [Suillus lakei]